MKTIRVGWGMTTQELADRLGVTATAVTKLENSERRGTIGLQTLERAAHALGCNLVYAVVPRKPLVQAIRDQAVVKATSLYPKIHQTMALESQELDPDEAVRAFDDLVSLLQSRRGLWAGSKPEHAA
jgi:predicted DNA-binding mobile mystery protein A